MKALTLYLPGKMQHPLHLIISVFDYQVIFNENINAIQILNISTKLRVH